MNNFYYTIIVYNIFIVMGRINVIIVYIYINYFLLKNIRT
jgi:hypothetical protein